MNKFIFAFFFILSATQCFAQLDRNNNDSTSSKKNIPVTYRLFATQNMWTFIKLNTRNGQMWQVQFSMKNEKRFVSNLSLKALVPLEKETDERFTLYPTQNMYTFILLDQLDGKTWQVQWATDYNTRGIFPIEE